VTVNVSSCQEIDSQGVYVLNQSLTNSSDCITIESSDVIFDGQGYSITGPGSSNYGIHIDKSTPALTNVTVRDVTVTGWSRGIYYHSAENGRIEDNIALNNDDGIRLTSSSSNILTSNAANLNNDNGIVLWSSNNNVLSNNTALNNYRGIYLRSSSSNTLTDNTVSNNSPGIYLTSTSSSNTIYNNHFNNTNNAKDMGSNDWNTTLTNETNIIGGPYLGGNFWAKPDGNGPSETCTDGDADGICDSGYTIQGSGNVDYLPLSLNFTTTTTSTTTTTTTSTTTTSTPSTTTPTTTTTTTTISTTTSSTTTTTLPSPETTPPPTAQIPEFPTVAIPAILALGGYLVIRKRRRE